MTEKSIIIGAGGLGLPNVAAMGRRAIAAVCKQDGRRFVTTE